MNYLSIDGLSLRFGDRILFEGLSFGLDKGDKTALIASNGTGKSTLLKIIAGKEDPDSGSVIFRQGIRTGFLSQEPELPENKTISEFVGEENFQIRKLLSIFGLNERDAVIGNLSGGQKKRLALAHVLYQQPDILLLDEPTNHLDVEMIEWLEEYLSGSGITLLMVTHDRYFLDRVCNRIIEMEDQKLYFHEGNYEYFLEKKAEREKVFSTEINKAGRLMEKELEWLRKQPRARTTKSKARIDAFDDIEKKAKSGKAKQELNLDVKMSRVGGKILEFIRVNKAFGEKVILKNFDYTFKKGERIGVVGPNGIGKSTFLNMVTGKEAADSGKIVTGETIVFGYYTQKGIQLKEDKRVIDVLKDIADVIEQADGRKVSASQFLEYFMFPPRVQYTPVSKLSGGEKRRLYLLTVLIRNPNFLILDEPTNDLDILTLNKLEEFLLAFRGCLLIVSHDRYFMDKLADHLFIFKGEGEVQDYYDTYSSYRAQFKQDASQGKVKTDTDVPVLKPAVKKLSYKEKLEYETLEKEIEKLEEEKKSLENELSSGISDGDNSRKLSERYSIVARELDTKSTRWLELAEKMN